VREVSLWMPRKNGKTSLAVPIVLYCLNYEGEVGAEGCISAGSEKQADVPYGAIRQTLEKTPELREWLLAKDTTESIRFRRSGATLKLLAGRAPNLDGLNPHIVLAEELHAQVQEVVGVLKTAQGARLQPLWLSISTAGRNAAGPAYDSWRSDQDVLTGKLKADRVFIAMYAAEEGDEERRFDPVVIEKVNPLYGVSLQRASLEGEEREARKSEAKTQEYKRTRLNIWSRAAGNLFSVEKWDACADRRLDLDIFRGFPLFVGFDLASASDLNAAAFVVEVHDCLHVVMKYWLPERSSRFQDDRYADLFLAWERDKHLTLTRGSHVHHPTILRDTLAMIRGHNVVGLSFDRYQADFLMGACEDEGYRVFTVAKTAKDVTRATDDLIARHIDPARLQHDGNPVTSWMVGNVVGFYDANGNVLPKKEKKDSKASIDGVDAIINANAARMADEAGFIDSGVKAELPNPYLQRGLLG
jgi:phage terminase large subunit-like protein